MQLSYISSFLSLAALTSAVALPSRSLAPKYAPIPPEAFGPPVSNVTGYRVEAFGQGAYMITDGLYQSLFLVSHDSVVVVDAPPTIGHKLLKGIRTVTDLPVTHVVYSHAHADHIGAAYLFDGPNVTFVAHTETRNELAQVNDSTRPIPSVTFSKQHNLKIGNQTLYLPYKGPNHEPGNIFIYAPKQRVLMLVDIIFPGWVPFDALGEVQNVPGFIKAHDQVLEYQFDHLVAGHLNRAGVRQDVVNQKEYVSDLYNNCVEAIRLSEPNITSPVSIAKVLPPVEMANPGNSWATFKAYIEGDVASYCADKTTAAWLGRLAGADVFGMSNAVTMIESVRIDFGILGPFGVTDT